MIYVKIENYLVIKKVMNYWHIQQGWILTVSCQVKKARLKRLHTGWFHFMAFSKRQTSRTENRAGITRNFRWGRGWLPKGYKGLWGDGDENVPSNERK